MTDRTKQRMERLKQVELEQLQWEQEALVMPEDLNRALVLSFESVKTEFSDLDGLSWSRSGEEPTPKLVCTEIPDPRTPAHSPSSRRPCTSDPTVRSPRSPLQPANQVFSSPDRSARHPTQLIPGTILIPS